jgi:hypothetical protein
MKNIRTLQVVSAILLVALVAAVILAVVQAQMASVAQAKLECAKPWLEKAGKLHDLHLKDAKTTTEASQLELMDQIMKAYECVTGEKMPMMGH